MFPWSRSEASWLEFPSDQPQLDAWKLGLVGGQDFRQDDPAAGMGYSDGKLSCGEILDVGDFLVGLIPKVQKLPGPGL